MSFGSHIRALREAKKAAGKGRYGLRSVAKRIGVDGSYIAHIEAGRRMPPNISFEVVEALAIDLDEDPDVLLAMAGFIRTDLREAIADRPDVFRSCVKQLRANVQDAARKVRDGDW